MNTERQDLGRQWSAVALQGTMAITIIGAAPLMAHAGLSGPMVGATDQGELVEVDRNTGELSTIGPLNAGQFGITGMAYDAASGTLYGSNGNNELYNVDPSTGDATFIGQDSFPGMNAIAVQPTTGVLYGATDTGFLWTIDTETGETTEVTQYGGSSFITGITFDSDGELYGIADNREIWSIDIATGDVTTLLDMDNFSSGAGHWETIAYDPAADVFYARQGNGIGTTTGLYEVDLNENTATLVGRETLDSPGVLGMAVIPAPSVIIPMLGGAGLFAMRRRRLT